MRRLLLAFILFSVSVYGQDSRPMRPRLVSTKPVGTCSERDFIQAVDTHKTSLCQNGAWADIATGSGISGLTTNTIPKATSATAIGDSSITDNGTVVGIPRNTLFDFTGGSNPTFPVPGLFVENNSVAGYTVRTHGNGNMGHLIGDLSAGTRSSPTLLGTQQVILRMIARGYNGAGSYLDSAAIDMGTDTAGTGSSTMPGLIDMKTVSNGGSTLTSRLQVNSAGQLKFPQSSFYIDNDNSADEMTLRLRGIYSSGKVRTAIDIIPPTQDQGSAAFPAAAEISVYGDGQNGGVAYTRLNLGWHSYAQGEYALGEESGHGTNVHAFSLAIADHTAGWNRKSLKVSEVNGAIYLGEFAQKTSETVTDYDPIDMLFLRPPALVAAGTKDSHGLIFTGNGFDSSNHKADWKLYVNTTSQAGASTFLIQNRVDAGSYATKFSITDAGKASATGVQLLTASKPTCDSTTRGTLWYVAGGAGVKDTVEVCGKDAGDAYAWRTIY